MLLARYAVGPVMETWTQIWFVVTYVITIAPSATSLGVLGIALEPNYLRVEATMSMHPHPLKRIGYRFLGCLRLLFT